MRRILITIIVPLACIALAIPMILQKIPRNGLYGFRTAYTLSSDEVWYRANRISGIALLVAGVVWLILGLVLPQVLSSEQRPYRLVLWLGTAAMAIAVAVSFWLTYGK
jgi:uncharacterized membrane protein